jgi:hypothetical protein
MNEQSFGSVYLVSSASDCNILIYEMYYSEKWQHLWSSGQSSWLQIYRSEFDARSYRILWEVVSPKHGAVSLVSKTDELRVLERKSSNWGLENRDYGRRESAALITRHRCIRKSFN